MNKAADAAIRVIELSLKTTMLAGECFVGLTPRLRCGQRRVTFCFQTNSIFLPRYAPSRRLIDKDENMQIKRGFGKTTQIGVTLGAGILLMATALKPQMPSLPAVGPVWEYSSVTGSPVTPNLTEAGEPESRATICYATATGCRNEQVTRPTGSARQGAEAMMIAAARLGEKGWELTSTTDVGESRVERVMYFKRLKSVLNRADTPATR
jgi:hypothetical protein